MYAGVTDIAGVLMGSLSGRFAIPRAWNVGARTLIILEVTLMNLSASERLSVGCCSAPL